MSKIVQNSREDLWQYCLYSIERKSLYIDCGESVLDVVIAESGSERSRILSRHATERNFIICIPKENIISIHLKSP